jgi:hypothetical protein
MVRTLKEGYLTYKNDHDATWILVFRHNTSFGFFSDKTQASYNLNENMFSIISRLSDPLLVNRYKSDCFEFLLEYPGDYPGEYNRWRQTNDPMKEPEANEDGKRNATGYSPVHIDWDKTYWGGMVKSSMDCALLDGSTYIFYWFYAIGDVKAHYSPKTPGPNNGKAGFVQLWVRVKTTKRFSCAMNKPFCKYFLFFCVFITSA